MKWVCVAGVLACGSSEAARTEVVAPTATATPAVAVTAATATTTATPVASASAVTTSSDTSGWNTGGESSQFSGGIGLGNVPDSARRSADGGVIRQAVRMESAQVVGRLPPEIIQRIARQHFAQVRNCYERGLARDPTLKGRVVTRFVIDTSGNTVRADKDPGTDLPSAEVVSCIVAVFKSLKFPEPEGGNVTVTYPLVFSPGD